jgi:hypothetical protein
LHGLLAGDRLLLQGISAFDAAAHCAAVSAARRLQAEAGAGSGAPGDGAAGGGGGGGGGEEQRGSAAAAAERQREVPGGPAAAAERPRAPHGAAQLGAAGRAGARGWLSRLASLLSYA